MAQVPQGALWCISVDADAQPIVMAHDRFLINAKKSVQCYGSSDGKLRWELPLDGIDRNIITSYAEQSGNLVIIQYGETIVQLNVETGKETWRAAVNADLLRKGSKCYRVLSEQRRTIVFTKDMKADIYDDVLGKRIGSIACKPNTDLISHDKEWAHIPAKENIVVLIDEAGVVVLDASTGKELLRRPLKFDDDITALHSDSVGCMVYGAEKLLYVNSTSGKFYERVFDHTDLRAQNLLNVNGKYSIWLSMKNRVVVINAEMPALLWESANGDGQFMGFAHKLFPALGGSTKGVQNVLTMYVEPRSEGDNPGTYLFAQSINTTTGRVLYRTLVAIASDVISTSKVEYIGMDYNVFEHKGRTCITVTSPSTLINPAGISALITTMRFFIESHMEYLPFTFTSFCARISE